MIQKMGTLSQVAIYGVANSAAFALSIVSNAVNNSFIPYMFQKMKSGEDHNIRALANILVIVVALFNFSLIVLAPEVMKLMAPVEYQKGMYLIPPLVCSVVVMFIYQMYCNVEFYYEKKYFLMLASIMVCICNGILNYIFIGLFGYLAAGYTTLTSHVLCLVAHFICMKKIIGNERRVLNNSFIIFVGISFLILSGIMLLFYDFPMVRYSILVIIVLVVILKRKILFEKFKDLKK